MSEGSRRRFFRDLASAVGSFVPEGSDDRPGSADGDHEQPLDPHADGAVDETLAETEAVTGLSERERIRYGRQIAQFGDAAQVELLESNVLIVGIGVLGAPAALYLAAAGIGQLGLLDDAELVPSDLDGQVIHFQPDLGVAKAESAAAKLRFLVPDSLIEPYRMYVDAESAAGLIAHDVVLDCSQDDATHRALERACASQEVPLVLGGVSGRGGWLLSVGSGSSRGYSDIFEQPPAEPAAGLISPVAGVVGSLMALEAIKWITGYAAPQLDSIRAI